MGHEPSPELLQFHILLSEGSTAIAERDSWKRTETATLPWLSAVGIVCRRSRSDGLAAVGEPIDTDVTRPRADLLSTLSMMAASRPASTPRAPHALPAPERCATSGTSLPDLVPSVETARWRVYVKHT